MTTKSLLGNEFAKAGLSNLCSSTLPCRGAACATTGLAPEDARGARDTSPSPCVVFTFVLIL
ncbi:hypothetical protein V6C53_05390 [Desulfocurvibacter africanus]|uniref:hypothetical protein n=1 Tax=Desulfocurvibacter africanus TaxID=873 RepID=UPI002FD9A127